MARFLIAFSFLIAGVITTRAGEVPSFLIGKTYSTDVKQCGNANDGDGDALQLSKDGIYGVEFGCQFVDFKYERDSETGRLFSVVATTSCGDDSGITRPDMISLSPYEEGGQVIVQSQNEYLLGETELIIAEKLGKDYPEKNSYAWVSNTYNICK